MSPTESRTQLLARLSEDYLARRRLGEAPCIEDYAALHPDLAQEIRELFGTLELVEQFGDDPRFDGADAKFADIPDRLGEFQLVREIARGGMGIVFEANQTTLARRVAVKVLPPSHGKDASRRARFQLEARAAANLHHTNIVPVFEVGEQEGIEYYAMQFIDGDTLAEVWLELVRLRGTDPADRSTLANANDHTRAHSISRHLFDPQVAAGPVDTDRSTRIAAPDTRSTSSPAARRVRPSGGKSPLARSRGPEGFADGNRPPSRHASRHDYFENIAGIMLQVVEALAYAHAHGVLHRDVKPANVILDLDGCAWLTDFGLAKLGSDPLTMDGNLLGTLRYMSPERFCGQVDQRSDVYGVGLMLYEFATLRPAIAASDHAGLMHLIQHVHPTGPRNCDPAIPKDLETIILRAIDKEPAQRYPTAEELATDLRRFLEGRPPFARRIPYREHAWRWCRRNPLIATLATALSCVILAAWAGIYVQWQRAEAARVESQAQLAIADSVNDFLQKDLLEQADIANQPLGIERDKDVTVRELLDRAATRIESRFSDQPLTESAIQLTLGNSYLALGEDARARQHLERSVELRRDLLGANHLDTLRALRSLGIAYLEQEQYDRARQTFQLAVDGFQSQRSAADPDVLTSRECLAMVYRGQGDFVEAERLLRDCLEHLRTTPAEGEELRLNIMQSLASVLDDRRQDEEAESLYRQVWEARKRDSGEDHPATLSSSDGLARVFYNLGRFGEAASLLQQAVDLRSAKLGPNHPSTLQSVGNLAAVYLQLGEYDQAEALTKQSIEGYRATSGLDHSDSLSAMNLLALIYLSTGRFEDAEPLLHDVAAGFQATLGAEHPMTLTATGNLASCYMELERYEDADPIYRQILQVRQRQLGPDHLNTLHCLNDVANVLNARGQYAEAEPLFQQIYAGRLAQSGADHLETLISLNNLAMIANELGKHDEAERLFRQALDGRRKNLGADHPDTLRTLNQLGELLSEAGRYDEAAPLLREAVDGARQRLGVAHPQTQLYLRNQALLLDRQGQPEMAEPLWRELIDALSARYGNESIRWADGMTLLAENLLRQERFAEAESVVRPAWDVRRRLEPDGWKTFDAEATLGAALLGGGKPAEAETRLLAGCQGLHQHREQIPPSATSRLSSARTRLVTLYESLGNEQEAARWRQEED